MSEVLQQAPYISPENNLWNKLALGHITTKEVLELQSSVPSNVEGILSQMGIEAVIA